VDSVIGFTAGSAAGSAISSAISSVIGPALSPIIGSIIGSAASLKCLTKGQSSFKVGEGVQSTAVKNFYLSVSSQRKNIYI